MPETLSLDEVAARAGETLEFIRRCHELGLMGRTAPDRFEPADVERLRMLRQMVVHGLRLEAVAEVERDHGLLSYFVEQVFATGPWPSVAASEAVERAGVPAALLDRILQIAGAGDHGGLVGEDDLEIAQGLKVALDAGLPKEALLQVVTVYADAMSRVADAEHLLFHFYVHERLRSEGLRGRELLEASIASSEPMLALVESAIQYFHRKATARVLREDAVVHMAEETGAAKGPEETGQLARAVVFVDLSGFTALTEAMGDTSAAEVIRRFADLVRPAASRHGGRMVKQIGDEFMVVFTRPDPAISFALDVTDRAARETHFSGTRTGVHWGPVLYREGDFYGANVNLAARLTGLARRHQVVASAAVRAAATEDPQVTFHVLGSHRLKGIPENVELFDVHHASASAPALISDVVCGMELIPDQAPARLDYAGREYAFCSTRCLQLFSADPGRYTAPT